MVLSNTPKDARKTRHDADEDQERSWLKEDETYDELHGYPDMTLLTDASFNFAHDKVLEAITDVEPWEPGWDELQAVQSQSPTIGVVCTLEGVSSRFSKRSICTGMSFRT